MHDIEMNKEELIYIISRKIEKYDLAHDKEGAYLLMEILYESCCQKTRSLMQ